MSIRKILSTGLAVLFISTTGIAQDYPFQDTRLSEEERLDNLISLMTLEEKINHLSSRLPGVPRLGLQGTRIVEGLHGLALSGPANWAVKGPGEAPTTTFPQSIGLAQMWDPVLLQELASWEAYETRYLTQNEGYKSAGLIVLAPNADLGRDIRWGRTEECYGEDAYLAGVMTTAYVRGLQGDDRRYWKTASLMKHFLANSNENNRTFNSSDFDDQLFHEYYGYPFYKGIVDGGSKAYMAAYNKYNGIPCAVHPVHKEITIPLWGNNGIICTDGGAFRQLITEHHYYEDLPHAAAACLDAGITMFLDRYKEPLKEAIELDLVSEEDIDMAVRGTLRVMLKLGLMDTSLENPYTSIGISDTIRPWMKDEARVLAREATRKSIVLLKNDGLLPLQKQKIKSVAVIGPSADLVVSDWYAGMPPYKVSVLDGIKNAVGDEVELFFAASNKADSAVIAARSADAAIVCVGNHPLSYNLGWEVSYVPSDGREGVDRQAISLEQEDLVRLVKQANPNTILVLISSFPYAINWSKEHVPAILHVAQSSQELGNGVSDVIFGDYSPAGRLVQTWAKSIEDLPPILEYNIRNGRTYMYNTKEVLFPFGYGLSYTSFEYSDLKMSQKSLKENEVLDVTVTIKNTGSRDSDEVLQLYVRYPESKVSRPNLALKGFQREKFGAGETRVVHIPLKAEDLKYWDTGQNSFVLEKGPVEILVGASSEDIRLNGSIKVK